jgi:hypothetical protein
LRSGLFVFKQILIFIHCFEQIKIMLSENHLKFTVLIEISLSHIQNVYCYTENHLFNTFESKFSCFSLKYCVLMSLLKMSIFWKNKFISHIMLTSSSQNCLGFLLSLSRYFSNYYLLSYQASKCKSENEFFKLNQYFGFNYFKPIEN